MNDLRKMPDININLTINSLARFLLNKLRFLSEGSRRQTPLKGLETPQNPKQLLLILLTQVQVRLIQARNAMKFWVIAPWLQQNILPRRHVLHGSRDFSNRSIGSKCRTFMHFMLHSYTTHLQDCVTGIRVRSDSSHRKWKIMLWLTWTQRHLCTLGYWQSTFICNKFRYKLGLRRDH